MRKSSCPLGRALGARAAGGGCAYAADEKGFEPCLSLLGESSSSPKDGDEGLGVLGLNGND